MQRPPGVGAFEFVIMASLRAAQLMRGCRPRIEGVHKSTVTAQLEIAEGKLGAQSGDEPVAATPVPSTVPAEQAVAVLAT